MAIGWANTERIIELLQRVAKKLETSASAPVVRPRRQSAPPPHPADSLAFHVMARVLLDSPPIFWHELPVENWVVLSAAELASMAPPGEWKVGASWEIPKKLAAKLYTNFYPPTEDTTDVDRNRIDMQVLQATAVAARNGGMRARLAGTLKMKRSMSPNPAKADNNFVDATVTGYLDVDPSTKRIQKLRLITSKATYGGEEFGVALRSMTAAELAGEPDLKR
ncbi:MAG: hypothetical protein ABIZ80_18835 [Bryobacteraceae bacterium]